MSASEELKEQLASTADPGERATILKSLGAAFLEEGKPTDAGRAFSAAVTLAPNDLEAVRGVRQALVAASRFPEAIQWYQREVALAPDDTHRAQLFKEIGDLFLNELRDLDNAQRAYARARHLDPQVFSTSEVAQATTAQETPKELSGHAALARPRKSTTSFRRRLVPLAVAVGVLLAGFFAVRFATRRPSAEAPAEQPCPEPTKLAVVEENRAAKRIVYECTGRPRVRRWTVEAGKTVELSMYADGLPDGPVVLTPEPGLRIEGQHVRGQRSGTWLEFRNGVLAKSEEWKEGQQRTSEEPQAVGSVQPDAGPANDAPIGPSVEELFAGMTVRGWRVRIAEVKLATKADHSLDPVWTLTLHRARLAGLKVNDDGQVEGASR